MTRPRQVPELDLLLDMAGEEASVEDLTESCCGGKHDGLNSKLIDLPSWTSFLVVFCSSCSLLLSLVTSDLAFLTSSVGFADGGDMYSHIAESLHLKTLVQSGYTDFWYPFVTLGYPMFLAYQPIPCITAALFMILLDGILSPLLIFRWLLVIIVSLLPIAWFTGGRWLGMTYLESTILALLVYSVKSWRNFGLELAALSNYGLNTQIWGMVFLPLTVGSLYKHIVLNQISGPLPIVLVTLNCLVHSFHGVYAAIATVVMVTVDWLSSLSMKEGLFQIRPAIVRSLLVYSQSLALLSWWLIPLILNLHFMGGLPWRTESEEGYMLGFIVKQFLSGEIYDSGRTIPFLTISVLWGIACVCIKDSTMSPQDKNRKPVYCFIGMLLVVTFALLLGRTMFGSLYNLIPLHTELEVIRYLSGAHFCGLILASIAISRFIRFICSVFCSKTLCVQQCLVAFILLVAPVSVCFDMKYFKEHLHMTEISLDHQHALKLLRDHPSPGRVYGSKDLGIQDQWRYAFVPQLSGKPGILTYSRGYHDSLSMFYVESLRQNMDLEAFPWLPHLLRLYNIRYLMSSGINYDPRFVKGCMLQTVVDSGGFTFHQINSNTSYGYFDFVHLPGAIYGDHKNIRQTVLTLLPVIQSNVLLFINPNKQFINQVNVSPMKSVNILDWLNHQRTYNIQWLFSGMETTGENFISGLVNYFSVISIRSRILDEKEDLNSFEALVEVSQSMENEKSEKEEYLLLKVTYHPYWKCFSSLSANRNLLLDVSQNRTWQEITVHHVIPNMMAVHLPTGKHHVKCVYQCPVYIKVLTVFCISILLFLIAQHLTGR